MPQGNGVEGPKQQGLLIFDGLMIELAARRIVVGDAEVHLTRSEFDLLVLLATNHGVVLTPAQLFESLWGTPWVGDGHAIEVQISRLRAKLGESSRQQRFIRTVRGVGYRFDAMSRERDVVLHYDSQMRVIDVEPADQTFFGWAPQDVIGRFFTLAAGPLAELDQTESVRLMRALAAMGPATSSIPYEVRCADGSIVLRTALVEIFKDEHGEFAGARTTVS